MHIVKLLFSTSIVCLILVGCTYSPDTAQQKLLQINTATAQKQHEQMIIAYFSPEAAGTEDFENATRLETVGLGYSTIPVKNGYYRKLLDRDQNGRYLVQDFFQNNDQKQTDPYWIKEISALKSFDSRGADGKMVAYFENGNVHLKHDFKNMQKIGKHEYHYNNGQIAFAEEIVNDQLILQKIWYENGKLAANLKINPLNNNYIFDSKVWDENGQLVMDDQKINFILEKLNSYF